VAALVLNKAFGHAGVLWFFWRGDAAVIWQNTAGY
jgi:hypothetical protein